MSLIRVEVSEGSDPLRPAGGLQPVTVQGLVVSDPEVSGPGVQFTLSVDAVLRDDGPEESTGRVLVFARPFRDLVLAREEPYFRY